MNLSVYRFDARWILIVCTFLLGVAGCASTPPAAPSEADEKSNTGPKPLVFAATGDGPYVPDDWTLLPQYFAAEKADGRARYMLHVGDLCKSSTYYDGAYSERVKALYQLSSIPTIFVIGDNEWNDQPDPWFAWPIWERDFLRFHEIYPTAPVTRRQPERPENIAWVDEGVLFIGLNLVGGFMHDVEEWAYRHRDNAEWVSENFDQYGDTTYAAVVYFQAAPNRKHEDFIRPFVAAATAYGKPVLVIQGDNHNWEYEPGWRAPNLTRIQVDQINKARPVHVIVSPDRPDQPFSFDRHGAGPITQEG